MLERAPADGQGAAVRGDTVPGGEGKGTFPAALPKPPRGTVHSQANSPRSPAMPSLSPMSDYHLQICKIMQMRL